MGRLSSIVLAFLFFMHTPVYPAFSSIRQNLKELRIKSHQIDLEARELEASKVDLQGHLKLIDDDLKKLNKEFFEVQRASVGRTSLQKGMSLFSARSFKQFLKQKRWTKNWMLLQHQINQKFANLKKVKSDKLQEIEKVALVQKEKLFELSTLETKILAEERHRRQFVRESEGEQAHRNVKFKENSSLYFLKPMDAKLVQKYGTSYVRPWDLTLQNWGWTYQSDKDEVNITAAAEGIVQAVEEIPYFGQVLIISHEGDFSTIYAGVHDILVKQGDHVASAALLAKAHRFYFELRHFTVPIDPSSWIRDPEASPQDNTQATRRAAL